MHRIGKIYFLAGLMAFIVACSPRTTEEVIEEEPQTEVTPPEETTPCLTFSKISARERDISENAYVLYRDLYKADEFEEALPLWKTAFSLAPAADGNIKYHFNDGVEIYKHLFETSTGKIKETYIDTIMAIYDKRVECYPEDKSYVDGRKAFDYFYSFRSYISDDELFNLFKRTVDSQGDDVDYFVINPFTKMLYDRVVSERISIPEGRKYAMKIFNAVDKGLANCKGTDCDAWNVVANYAPPRLETLEGVDGFYDCKYYVDKYYPQFVEHQDDCDAVRVVYARMTQGKCDINSAELQEVKRVYEENCKQETPSGGPLREAFDLYTNGEYQASVDKFEEYIESTEEVEKKIKYLMMISRIYYRDIRNFSKSRQYARKALDLNPNLGEAYILIGKLYASSGPLCGPGTGFDSQVVTWVAIDKFIQAKNVDSSVSAEANRLISQYSRYMPTKEDLFLRGINEGETYTVGCWIQEKTRVRVAD